MFEIEKSTRDVRPQTRKDLSLKDLATKYPVVWQEVVAELRERVASNSGKSIEQWRADALRNISQSARSADKIQVLASQTEVKSQMILLAIQQFSDVMTGRAGIRASLKDRAIMQFLLLRSLSKGRLLTARRYDQYWRLFKDPLWASGELQRHGFWSIPSAEFADRMKEYCQGQHALELGAGHGLLSSGLRKRGVQITAIDDNSWKPSKSILPVKASGPVQFMDASQALKKFNPQVVICSWPPAGNQFEHEVFKTRSVQTYFAIVSKHSFASGDWQAYKSQSQFVCTTSESLNLLLRPLESEQQVLIFRRK